MLVLPLLFWDIILMCSIQISFQLNIFLDLRLIQFLFRLEMELITQARWIMMNVLQVEVIMFLSWDIYPVKMWFVRTISTKVILSPEIGNMKTFVSVKGSSLIGEHDTKLTSWLRQKRWQTRSVSFGSVFFICSSFVCVGQDSDLEAFSVYNSRTRFIVFLFGDPHLLESW